MSDWKRARPCRADRSFWLFGGIILALTAVDLFVFAGLWNRPNPISAMLIEPPRINLAVPPSQSLFVAPKSAVQ